MKPTNRFLQAGIAAYSDPLPTTNKEYAVAMVAMFKELLDFRTLDKHGRVNRQNWTKKTNYRYRTDN